MSDVRQEYLRWFYDTNVWKRVSYRGVRTLKLPLDMWNYQELIFENNVQWVLETGTRHGGGRAVLCGSAGSKRPGGVRGER